MIIKNKMGFLKDLFVDIFLCSCMEKPKKTKKDIIPEDDTEYYESHV